MTISLHSKTPTTLVAHHQPQDGEDGFLVRLDAPCIWLDTEDAAKLGTYLVDDDTERWSQDEIFAAFNDPNYIISAGRIESSENLIATLRRLKAAA